MRKTVKGLLGALLLGVSSQAAAFCGFYVAKADTGLFNESSQVVYVRDENRNVVTMASDFKGDVKDFALVVPVPTVLKREQINVANHATLEHLDAYSAPRLVEYFDEDPCMPMPVMAPAPMMKGAMMEDATVQRRAADLGVKIEAQYTVAEYDILLLSAKESGGLITWLTEQGYKLPPGAEPVVGSYLKQDMKFFVARVNLQEYSKSGYTRLRPIQIAYNHDKFMLPIRLGTVNAQGKQELFVYALTRTGRVETTNYRTVKLPSDVDVPAYIKDKDEFASFYRDMFRTAVDKENGKAVFLEYAWDMNWCDPCAADPLTDKELRELGVFWVAANGNDAQPQPRGMMMPPPQGQDVYVSRLHVRYDRDNFPEDLMFQTTGDRENFQGRYIIRHPFKGEASCDAGKQYFRELPKRQVKVAETLARLTNRDISGIRKKMGLGGSSSNSGGDDDWWNSMWGRQTK
ncbi:MAG: DUF2330 domain-containing protein [Gammaproteobacteria bacterium]|nr:DUF2330 domain-containing protein [Gammaproteobacteria bacterium]